MAAVSAAVVGGGAVGALRILLSTCRLCNAETPWETRSHPRLAASCSFASVLLLPVATHSRATVQAPDQAQVSWIGT